MKKIKKVKFIEEFKTFVSRGNVIDLAVGVIIGGAFKEIVNSLVDNIIMPLMGIILGGLNFTNLTLTVGNAVIKYGIFIQNTFNFFIIAFCIFVFVKFMNKLSAKKEETVNAAKPEDVKLLEEIRDLLKKEKNIK